MSFSFPSFFSLFVKFGGKRKRSATDACPEEPVSAKQKNGQGAIVEAENSTFATTKRSRFVNLDSIHSPVGKQARCAERHDFESDIKPKLRQIEPLHHRVGGYGQARLGQAGKTKAPTQTATLVRQPFMLRNNQQQSVHTPQPVKKLDLSSPATNEHHARGVSPFISRDNKKRQAFEKFQKANMKEQEAAALRAEGKSELLSRTSLEKGTAHNGRDLKGLREYQKLLDRVSKEGLSPQIVKEFPVAAKLAQFQSTVRGTEHGQPSLATRVITTAAFQNLDNVKARKDLELKKQEAESSKNVSLQLFDTLDQLLKKAGSVLDVHKASEKSMAEAIAVDQQLQAQLEHRKQFFQPHPVAPLVNPQAVQQRSIPALQGRPPKAGQEEVVLLSSDDEDKSVAEEQLSGLAYEYSDDQEEFDEEEPESDEYTDNEQEEDVREGVAELHVGFRDFTEEQTRLIRHALSAKGLQDEILVKHENSNIFMTRELIQCMHDGEWLNDEVINIYMGLLQDRDTRLRNKKGGCKCHFWNSFFINKLYKDKHKYNYAAVSRWSKPTKLRKWGQASETVLDVDKIIFPVHLGMHWTCAVVNIRDQQLIYYDSMGGEERGVMESLARYIVDEYKDKKKMEVDTSNWERLYPKNIPHQRNGYDCGVFTLKYADYVARDAPLNFSQAEMKYIRDKIVLHIMTGHVE